MINPRWGAFRLLLMLVWPLPSFSLQLFDAESFIYDVGDEGALIRGSLDAYDHLYRLRINGANYTGQIIGLSPNGRKIQTSAFTEPRSGLEVERQIYVSKTNNFARYTEIIRNPTAFPQAVEIEIFGNLGSGNETVIIEEKKNYLITDDHVAEQSGSRPVLLHYHSQAGHTLAATHTLSINQLSWIYPSVTVPPATEIQFIYFVAQTTDVEAANRLAAFIFNNPTALYETIPLTDLTKIVNFTPPRPSTEVDFSHAPFLSTGELRSGVLTEDDKLSVLRANTPADVYALNLAAEEPITIRLSAYFNTYLYLFADEFGKDLLKANDDLESETTAAEITFIAPQEGIYYLEATAHDHRDRGPYTLEILKGNFNRTPLAQPIEFPLTELTAPATVTFTDFSQDPDGRIVQRCWQFGDGSPLNCVAEETDEAGALAAPPATITHLYQTAGYYSVGLTIKDDQGAYAHRNEQLAIKAVPQAVVLPLSSTLTTELASSSAGRSQTRSSAFANRYLISSAQAGQELVVDMQAEDFDSYLYLYDQYNRLLRQDDNGGGGQHARLRYTPMHSGDLLLEATSFKDNTLGNYSLTLARATPNAALIVPVEALTFLTNPLQNLFIARVPDSFQPNFFQWDFGDKSPVTRTDEAVVAHTFPKHGQFTLTVTALDATKRDASGTQLFTINNEVSAPQPRFRASPLFGETPLRVFFTNESFSTLQGDNLSYVWQFGDGEVATTPSPAHTFTREGTYHVILQAYSTLTQQSASFSLPITVIDRSSSHIPVVGTARLRPQVLLAGFDPMLVDLLDTEMKVFALIRPGDAPIQTVRAIQNDSNFVLVMQHVATYANGDQHYEAVYPFVKGTLPVSTFANLFGDKTGQFRIQAIDQAGQFHSFPNLEIGHNPPLATVPLSLHIEPLQQVGVRRSLPQVLAAGFDPALVDATDGQFTIKAIVREGLFPIQQVNLKQNKGDFDLPMHQIATLPNGDKLYAVTYTYPRESLKSGTLGNLFGDQPSPDQFKISVTDQAQQVHRFPEFKIGNFPKQ